MIEVIDNFLPKYYFESIANKILINFPWYYKNDITFPREKTLQVNDLESFGFEHLVYDNNSIFSDNINTLLSGFFGMVKDCTNTSEVTKCRIDMTVCTKPKFMHLPHVDAFVDHVASVFYLSDSDGDTVIFENKCFSLHQMRTIDFETLNIKKIIKPKANRILFFDGRYLHTGHSPSEHKNRIIINTDLI